MEIVYYAPQNFFGKYKIFPFQTQKVSILKLWRHYCRLEHPLTPSEKQNLGDCGIIIPFVHSAGVTQLLISAVCSIHTRAFLPGIQEI
jgi:hypothetical protein